MRDIGLHLRLNDSIHQVAQKAAVLQLPIFQCFLLNQETNRFIEPSDEELYAFKNVRSQFKQLFVHSAYWTNLASIKSISLKAMRHELRLAKKLGFSHLIVHPGSAKGAETKEEGINAVVRRLNKMLKDEDDIVLVLENTAHGKLAIGSDLDDFKVILERIDFPEKIAFCIDTVHAHAFGYPIAQQEKQELFLEKIEQTVGVDRIALIHLNNTSALAGSCIDRHSFLTDGIIHLDALKQFVLNRELAHVPLVMELPTASLEIEKEQVNLVRCWHQ